MSTAATDLLADLLPTQRPAGAAMAATPANAAKAAKEPENTGLAPDSKAAKRLRIAANPTLAGARMPTDSQAFAAVRNSGYGTPAQETWGSSQDSQHSHGGPPTAQPIGRWVANARQQPEDARELLDCLLWLQPSTGALSAKALALATGWPLGMVLAALDRLQGAAAVRRAGRDYAVTTALLRELRAGP